MFLNNFESLLSPGSSTLLNVFTEVVRKVLTWALECEPAPPLPNLNPLIFKSSMAVQSAMKI